MSSKLTSECFPKVTDLSLHLLGILMRLVQSTLQPSIRVGEVVDVLDDVVSFQSGVVTIVNLDCQGLSLCLRFRCLCLSQLEAAFIAFDQWYFIVKFELVELRVRLEKAHLQSLPEFQTLLELVFCNTFGFLLLSQQLP